MMKIVSGYSTRAFLRATGFVLLGLALFYLIHVFRGETHAELDHQITDVVTESVVSFDEQVRPILNKRCVVCHSCYDAPCQLKLSSVEGVSRGANEEKVYNTRRLTAMDPTRLFIDAKTTTQWRDKGFQSVIDKSRNVPALALVETFENASSTYDKPLLQLLLELKQFHPQPAEGKLPDDFTLDLDREQTCPTHDTFDDYANDNPLWGMPYAMPNLEKEENQILINWLEEGAPMPAPDKSAGEAKAQVEKWEAFFNQQSNKQRLVSRYIYEHLFHAHIHFDGTPLKEFYRLVRSYTPTGKPVDEIATLRPYDDPEVEEFYYRLLRFTPIIVAKNHIVYELSDKRLQRYQQLFFKPDYNVKQLPSYEPEIASNPFKVYAAIPPDSRYRFLLDEARFFIEGFIKGPVCRGQIALNVIEDNFWVMFFNPDQKIFTTQASFLNNMSDYLRIPSERGSHLNPLLIWTEYWKQQKQYMLNKQRYFESMSTHSLKHAMSYLWDGDGVNPNAALTIFRHFDSASVEFGFVGEQPETAWVIDYPLFERIHYLLVAGFNVYGNVVHQLSTRIYMDFLRMEGEDHFLVFLPASKRKAIRDSWYQGVRSELDELFKAPLDWLNVESVTDYQTEDVQAELFQHINLRLTDVLRQDDSINHCGNSRCPEMSEESQRARTDEALYKIAGIHGKNLHAFPEVSYLRVVTDDPEISYMYSLIRNKAYKNVVSLLSDERERDLQDVEKDSMTVINWLAGSYPNFFFTIDIKDVDKFVAHCTEIETQESFDSFVERYGVRRTNPLFWETVDWFQEQYARQHPLRSGLYDLSRYSNL